MCSQLNGGDRLLWVKKRTCLDPVEPRLCLFSYSHHTFLSCVSALNMILRVPSLPFLPYQLLRSPQCLVQGLPMEELVPAFPSHPRSGQFPQPAHNTVHRYSMERNKSPFPFACERFGARTCSPSLNPGHGALPGLSKCLWNECSLLLRSDRRRS